jgi:hypothetical protein
MHRFCLLNDRGLLQTEFNAELLLSQTAMAWLAYQKDTLSALPNKLCGDFSRCHKPCHLWLAYILVVLCFA